MKYQNLFLRNYEVPEHWKGMEMGMRAGIGQGQGFFFRK
jgi:hypothetical protein